MASETVIRDLAARLIAAGVLPEEIRAAADRARAAVQAEKGGREPSRLDKEKAAAAALQEIFKKYGIGESPEPWGRG
jgi:hypothetical protein